jgi:hypothetical protein
MEEAIRNTRKYNGQKLYKVHKLSINQMEYLLQLGRNIHITCYRKLIREHCNVESIKWIADNIPGFNMIHLNSSIRYWESNRNCYDVDVSEIKKYVGH